MTVNRVAHLLKKKEELPAVYVLVFISVEQHTMGLVSVAKTREELQREDKYKRIPPEVNGEYCIIDLRNGVDDYADWCKDRYSLEDQAVFTKLLQLGLLEILK